MPTPPGILPDHRASTATVRGHSLAFWGYCGTAPTSAAGGTREGPAALPGHAGSGPTLHCFLPRVQHRLEGEDLAVPSPAANLPGSLGQALQSSAHPSVRWARYPSLHTHAHTCAHSQACTHIQAYANTHKRPHMCTLTSTYTLTGLCKHAHTNPCTHTYPYALTKAVEGPQALRPWTLFLWEGLAGRRGRAGGWGAASGASPSLPWHLSAGMPGGKANTQCRERVLHSKRERCAKLSPSTGWLPPDLFLGQFPG